MFEWKASQQLVVRRGAIRENMDSTKPSCFVYASDLHLAGAWTAKVVDELVSLVHQEQPSFVMLGGDLVDRKKALPLLLDCVSRLRRVCPVLAVPGNHDGWVGLERVRACVLEAGGVWLIDQPWSSSPPSDTVVPWSLQVDGVCSRASSEERRTFRILCAHYPSVFPKAIEAGYDLVLAGHLHGGQAVLHQSSRGLMYPGAWFFRWNGLVFEEQGCRMWVNRGANDTFPLRWNCPREVLVGLF